MTNDEWRRIVSARNLLGLGEAATLAEIKAAYRRSAKRHHPDLAGDGEAAKAAGEVMRRLTEAYRLLMDYGAKFRIPLEPGEDQPLEGEDWWMERFGDDPLWSPGRKKI